MVYSKFPSELYLKRLAHPGKKVRMVLDTDTYNEVDDQFALAYALKSQENMTVEAVYAAPFLNSRVETPLEGMEKSYEEILHILRIMNIKPDKLVYKGSTGFLQNAFVPQESAAVCDLVKRALSMEDEPLYVVAIGAITNIASAILMEPRIIEKIIVVWLGGHSFFWPDTKEFNLEQDLHASRIIFDCGVPLIHIPCCGVTTHLSTTISELDQYLYGKNELGTYLVDIVRNYSKNHFAWSKVIWDVAAIAWLVNPDWLLSNIVHSPILTDQYTWSFDNNRHFIRSVAYLDRDKVFGDLFKKLG